MKISILGDSISTFEGCHSNDCNVYYTGLTNKYANLTSYHDTWWGIVIDGLQAELLRNHSYSGSCISALSEGFDFYPDAISPQRYAKLHYNDEHPDVILVYMGINDWLNETCIKHQYAPNQPWHTCFQEACMYLFEKLKETYPNSKIGVISPVLGTIDGYLIPAVNGDCVSLKMFQNILEDCAYSKQIKYIDITTSCPYYASMDGFHPDVEGMKQLGEAILKEVRLWLVN